jgi:hypothetical protein
MQLEHPYVKSRTLTVRRFPRLIAYLDDRACSAAYLREFLSRPAAGSPEQAGIHRVDDRRSRNAPASEESAVESLDRFFAAADLVELDVYLALTVGVKRNVNNMAILFLTFRLNIILQFFDPSITGFSVGD